MLTSLVGTPVFVVLLSQARKAWSIMLEIQKLQYWYRPGRPVLRDISFSAGRGEIVCLLGPNGTGKTTLLRCLLGLNAPKGGCVTLDGQNLSALRPRRGPGAWPMCPSPPA